MVAIKLHLQGSMMNDKKLILAIQKSGRLSESSLDLIKQLGIKLNRSKDQLIGYGQNFPIEILLTRDDDIPTLLNEGTCDIGIVGRNVTEEFIQSQKAKDKQVNFKTATVLPFGACKLSFAVPNDSSLGEVEDYANKKIATSYPYIVSKYLSDNNITAECIEFKGSVEIGPKLGICDLICDLVSTGTTLRANGLRETLTLLESTAELVQYNQLNETKTKLVTTFIERVNAVIKASNSRYIMLHAPLDKIDTIVSLLPGSESPTVIPLSNAQDKVAIHSLCNVEIFWDTLENLKAEGASSILVLPIEKILD